MDLARLMSPRSIAVVGATPRAETYAHETLRNLATIGYDGDVWGVHPVHREVLGRPVFPSLADGSRRRPTRSSWRSPPPPFRA